MSHTYGTSSHVTTPDGRRLHLMSRGQGSPTVVLESGMGMSRSCWGLVVPALAEDLRTVVYDRANLGRSDADPEPRTLERLTGDLLTVLDHVDGAVVLVGHSWGGPVIRKAAAHVGPDKVAGLVLVDQVDEHADLYFAPSAEKRFVASARYLPPMARLGLYRALGARAGSKQPADVRADHRAEDFTVAAARGMAAELTTFLDDLADLRDHPLDLHGIPTSVISGTRPTRLDKAVREAVTAAHRRTAETIPGARLVAANGSAHLVNFTEPEVVVAEVRRLAGG